MSSQPVTLPTGHHDAGCHCVGCTPIPTWTCANGHQQTTAVNGRGHVVDCTCMDCR